ncbi:putative acetyltransferase/hydrolase with alpha/beta hydrolase fold [Fervidobacterium pennivorans DSM 9078]|uniref:Acetyltransferase/hydrolase with alpha/beta hydrolase fold n=2 Tax=Fervidobacterium pennivorans TaxID=93466 RepID=H9UE65_FERPD|nr:putative acetyltransferase/hydrolase with alpha/beta hydrolase fold [Fervidobacterium pennivorans DSM 9078]
MRSFLLIFSLTFLMSSTLTFAQGNDDYGIYYVYYNTIVPVYKTLYKIDPFFEYTKVVEYRWKRSETRLVEIRKPRNQEPSVILIHGIDPNEINGEWTNYKNYFVDTWKRCLPEEYGLYIFVYPSLDIPLEESAKKLVQEIQKLALSTEQKCFNFYAHSMGGLLLRYALQDSGFRNHVAKVIFAGTPHIGSPFANFIVMNKKILKLRNDWDYLKMILISANSVGIFIEAPNYDYLLYGREHPGIPETVEFMNFASVIKNNNDPIVQNILRTEPFSSVVMIFLNSVSRVIFPEGEFTKNDGMVPLISATAFGKSEIFEGFDHADFILSDIIVKNAIEFFYPIEKPEKVSWKN